MTSKAKTITKLKRSLRAISPVLSVLMMIAIAVAVSLVAYAWIMGYIGGTTSKVGKAIQIQSYYANPTGTELYVYVQNVGQGTVEFDSASCVYIDDVLRSATISPTSKIEPGATGTFAISGLTLDVTKSVRIKVVTMDGTAMEAKGIPYVATGGANHAPVLATIGNKGVNELETLSFTATATDSDVPAQTLTYSLVSAPAGASIDPNTGVFTWTPTEAQGPGDYTFTVRVTDNGVPALSDQEEITVTVTEGNQPPELAAIGDKGVNELVELSFTATATDPDVPSQTLTFSLDAGAPAGASITSGGAFAWTPTEAQGPGSYPVTVRVSDGAAEDFETITITVSEVNVAPVLEAIGDKTVDEETLLTFDADANDADIPANTLTYSLIGAPSGASINPSTGVFTWTPTEAQGPGDYTFTVRVTDNGVPALYDEESINVHVNEVTAPAVLDHFDFDTISSPKTAGTAFSITIRAKDQYNNPFTGYIGTNTLTVSSGTISPTSTGTFTAGVWTGTVTLYTSGSGITIGTSGGGKSGTSNAITVNPGSGTFGNTNQGSFSQDTEDRITGGQFTCSQSGTAQSITAYIIVGSTRNLKAAIYTSAGTATLVGSTEEKSVSTSTDGWVTFNFLGTKPTLNAGTTYTLVVWSDDVSGGGADLYYSSSGGTGRYNSRSYGSWPSSVSFSSDGSRNYSIYCTYSIP